MVEFVLNNQKIRTAKPAGFLLLDYIRQEKGLVGTKIGCREGDCGACNVLVGTLREGRVDYLQLVSCLTPLGNVHGKHVVTVEGLNMQELSPVQRFLVEEAATQCGFCTVGFVISLTAYCLSPYAPSRERVMAAMDGNVCRCTGYKSIERAAQRLTQSLQGKDTLDPVSWLVHRKFLPAYFLDIPSRLTAIKPLELVSTGTQMVGGGSDLYVQQPEQLVHTEPTLLNQRPELRFIEIKEGICTLGGGTTFSDLLQVEAWQRIFPRLPEHLKLVASTPIRNQATLAGNLVNASPIGDLTIFLLALNARITLTHKRQSRTLYLKDFFKVYKVLDKREEEVVQSISFALPSPKPISISRK
jgi:xanthine dehydrogenase small subunit